MRQFYIIKKGQPLVDQLIWTDYIFIKIRTHDKKLKINLGAICTRVKSIEKIPKEKCPGGALFCIIL